MTTERIQRLRLFTRLAFFTLFVIAPPLDLFRLDLTLGHFIFFGHHWTLGLADFINGQVSALQATLNIMLYGFLPIAATIGIGVWVSWRYGRIYCGWFCPHFSVVEVINAFMRRACGKASLWDNGPLPQTETGGAHYFRNNLYWVWAITAIGAFAALWALTLLTYLLPPEQIYSNLLNGELTRNQTVFISVATLAFSVEFLLARHLFCRFGCAVGLFQSLAWMTNDRALVMSFDRSRGEQCRTCTQACDNACPMRLNPRKNKRHMFTCTQCGRCEQACQSTQAPGESLLHWQRGAKDNSQAPVHFNHKKNKRGL